MEFRKTRRVLRSHQDLSCCAKARVRCLGRRIGARLVFSAASGNFVSRVTPGRPYAAYAAPVSTQSFACQNLRACATCCARSYCCFPVCALCCCCCADNRPGVKLRTVSAENSEWIRIELLATPLEADALFVFVYNQLGRAFNDGGALLASSCLVSEFFRVVLCCPLLPRESPRYYCSQLVFAALQSVHTGLLSRNVSARDEWVLTINPELMTPTRLYRVIHTASEQRA